LLVIVLSNIVYLTSSGFCWLYERGWLVLSFPQSERV